MRILVDKTGWDEETWQEFRAKQKGIGGSEVATILGLNPYKSAFSLWLEKTGQVERPTVDNQYIEWGNILEPVIREKFAKETGLEVFTNPYVMAHDHFDFMVANIDGEVVENGHKGVLEIKTASERYKRDWEDGPPNHYMLQIQHYLAVMGEEYQFAYCAVLIGGNDFRYFRIERDEFVIDHIIAAESKFAIMVEKMISPEITGTPAETDWLNDTYPEDNGESCEMSEFIETLTAEYIAITAQIKDLQADADSIKNRIKQEAQDYKLLKGQTVKVSIPTIRKVIFDQKRFAEEHPELYEDYKTKESSYRGFNASFL